MKRFKRLLCVAVAAVQAVSVMSTGVTVSAAKAQKVNYKTIAAGDNFSLVIKSDLSLWAAGDNSHGQLGVGGDVDNSDGCKVMEDIIMVEAEGETAYAIDASGTLYGWGDNADGQVAPSQTAQYIYKPTKIMDNVIEVSAGESHTIALAADGTAYGWGSNSDGELGFTANSKTNAMVKLKSGISDIAAGDGFTILVSDNGTVYTSGTNSSGQLGTGDYRVQHTFLAAPVSGIAAAEAGDSHVLLLTEKGKVLAAGLNDNGQVGAGTASRVNRFTELSVSNVESVFAGAYSSAAVTGSGGIHIWGNNDNGQLQNNSDKDVTAPKYLGSGYISADFGGYHSVMLKKNGTVMTAGAGMNGELFSFTGSVIMKPEKIMENIEKYSVGADHAAAIDEKGDLFVWGNNDCGQLGLGDLASRNKPVKVDLPSAINVWCGNKVTFVQTTDLRVYVFGDNTNNMLGMDTDKTIVSKPEYNFYLSDYKNLDIECGNGFAVAIIDGDVYGWGKNVSGRLCDHGKLVSDPNLLTAEISNVIDIAVGDNHVLALTSNYDLYGWGGNGSSQLGINVEDVFVDVPTLIEVKSRNSDKVSVIKSVSAAGNHSIVTDADERVWVWGANSDGQLGVSDYRVKSPIALGYLGKKVEAGRYACAIINPNNKLSLSGSNKSGALGDGTQTDRSKFSEYSAEDVTSVQLGDNFGFYLNDEDELFGWGENALGQVGTGTGGVSTKPVAAMKGALCSEFTQATAVSLNKQEIVLKPNGSQKLSAKITPSNTVIKTITWSSSESKVATVSADGTVTAHDYGETTITATTSNGVAATCKVVVTIPVSSFSVSPRSKTLTIGKSFTITNKTYPSNALDKTLLYKSSDTDVATVSSTGKVTAVSTGVAKITVTAKSNPSKTRTVTVYVRPAKGKFTTKKATTDGILFKWDETEGADGYVIYRRPSAKGKTTIVADVSAEEALTYLDTSVKSGKVYYYYIKAYYEVGSSRVYAPSSSLYKIKAK